MTKKIYIFIIVVVSIVLVSCGSTIFIETYTGTGGDIIDGVNTFTIDVPDEGWVLDVFEITLTDLNYAAASDLQIRAEKVDSHRVTLLDQRAGTNAFTGTYTFVDNSDEAGLSRIVTYTGVIVPEVYQSEADFGIFEETVLTGTWQLTILDWTAENNGTLGSWSIELEYDERSPEDQNSLL